MINDLKYRHIHNTISIVSQKDDIVPGFLQINSDFMPELMLTGAECDAIMATALKTDPAIGRVGKDGKSDLSVRDVQTFDIPLSPESSAVYDKIAYLVTKLNAEFYDFDLSAILHSFQAFHYQHKPEGDGHYDWHVDLGPGWMATRKLSLSVELSDGADFEGGVLEINNHGPLFRAKQERGAISVFPSYLPHRVSPVTSGSRWSLVIWVHGYRRFK